MALPHRQYLQLLEHVDGKVELFHALTEERVSMEVGVELHFDADRVEST